RSQIQHWSTNTKIAQPLPKAATKPFGGNASGASSPNRFPQRPMPPSQSDANGNKPTPAATPTPKDWVTFGESRSPTSSEGDVNSASSAPLSVNNKLMEPVKPVRGEEYSTSTLAPSIPAIQQQSLPSTVTERINTLKNQGASKKGSVNKESSAT